MTTSLVMSGVICLFCCGDLPDHWDGETLDSSDHKIMDLWERLKMTMRC